MLKRIMIFIVVTVLFLRCSKEREGHLYVPPTMELSKHPNDVYLREKMFEKHGTAVRWRWDDRFIRPTQKATPIIDILTIPVTKIVEYLWIGPYESYGQQGIDFIEELFPPELQYIGSYIYNRDGTSLSGYAEGGARITLLNLNAYSLSNVSWLRDLLFTIHHELSHLVHQNYGMPSGFRDISGSYKGNGWSSLNLNDAIKLGMVRNYGTLSEYEDFSEIVSNFLVLDEKVFNSRFINQSSCTPLTAACTSPTTASTSLTAECISLINERMIECRTLNEGKKLIKKKLDLVLKFYKQKFDIDLKAVRDSLQRRLSSVVTNNKIPL